MVASTESLTRQTSATSRSLCRESTDRISKRAPELVNPNSWLTSASLGTRP